MRKVNKSEQDWREQLSPDAYQVTREKGTERPFTGKYYENKHSGVYHCVCCDATLFDSAQKYESGSGWPSFWEAVDSERIECAVDRAHGTVRTEITCKECGAHLGHVFDDGPQPTGMRYCVNSVSLDFRGRDG